MLTFSPEISQFPDFAGGVSLISTQMCTPPVGSKAFDAPDLKKALKTTPEGAFLLLEEEFGALSDYGISEAQFATLPGFELTREESAHQVQFGELIITTSDGMRYGEHVAIKPYDMPADAAYEAGAMITLNQLESRPGRLASFLPLGFYRYVDGSFGLISKYDPAVRTQDGVFWNPDRLPTEKEAVKALGLGACSLARLHSSGYSHGDSQVKNTAHDLRGVRYVDLADMRRVGGRVSPDLTVTRLRDDVGKYLSSLAGPTDRDSSQYADIVPSAFIAPYLKKLSVGRSVVPEEARLSSQEIRELLYHS